MNLRELKDYKVSPPFTVSEIFNDNFFINISIKNSIDMVFDVIFSQAESHCLFDVENSNFEYEKIEVEDIDNIRIYLSGFNQENEYIILTLLYDSENDTVRYIMEDYERRLYILCYAQKLFSIILKRYGINMIWGCLHENEVTDNGEEENHVHFIFSFDKKTVKFSDFERDFKEMIAKDNGEDNEENESFGD